MSRKSKSVKTTNQLDLSLVNFANQVEREFQHYGSLISLEPEFVYKGEILKGTEKRDPKKEMETEKLSRFELFELNAKLGSTEKGLYLLASMVTDWDIQTIEFKKLIQLVKEGIPKSVAGKPGKSRGMFDSIHAWITRNMRAKTWLLVQQAAWEAMQEFPSLEIAARQLIKKIQQLLKKKTKKQAFKHGLDWKYNLCSKPTKWDEKDHY